MAKLQSVWLYYVPASTLWVCLFLFCSLSYNIWAHAAGISTYQFPGQISNTVSIIRGKKEMFEKTKIVKNTTKTKE